MNGFVGMRIKYVWPILAIVSTTNVGRDFAPLRAKTTANQRQFWRCDPRHDVGVNLELAFIAVKRSTRH